jgi:hypothetical protein
MYCLCVGFEEFSRTGYQISGGLGSFSWEFSRTGYQISGGLGSFSWEFSRTGYQISRQDTRKKFFLESFVSVRNLIAPFEESSILKATRKMTMLALHISLQTRYRLPIYLTSESEDEEDTPLTPTPREIQPYCSWGVCDDILEMIGEQVAIQRKWRDAWKDVMARGAEMRWGNEIVSAWEILWRRRRLAPSYRAILDMTPIGSLQFDGERGGYEEPRRVALNAFLNLMEWDDTLPRGYKGTYREVIRFWRHLYNDGRGMHKNRKCDMKKVNKMMM